jgi:phosphoribosylformylglycinamidine (FGAM) synthase-like enzyme
VVGCVGIVLDVRRVPSRWQSGDVVLLATSPDGSLAAEAALIRFLWKAAPHLTLCHDVGSGGVAAALAEATAWSGGLEANVELPADYDSRRGAAILACRPERVSRLGARGFVRIGEVR